MSEYDRYCPFYKTSAMLRNFVGFHDAAIKAVTQNDLTFAKVKDSTSDIMFKLSQMKFEVSVVTFCVLETEAKGGKVAVPRKGINQKETR
jgi:vacuolar-type H+-ATPase catalytic subunit A/Vma1